jgi:hypothetical protein
MKTIMVRIETTEAELGERRYDNCPYRKPKNA